MKIKLGDLTLKEVYGLCEKIKCESSDSKLCDWCFDIRIENDDRADLSTIFCEGIEKIFNTEIEVESMSDCKKVIAEKIRESLNKDK